MRKVNLTWPLVVAGESDRPVNTEDRKKLQYLECVVKESLRQITQKQKYRHTNTRMRAHTHTHTLTGGTYTHSNVFLLIIP